MFEIIGTTKDQSIIKVDDYYFAVDNEVANLMEKKKEDVKVTVSKTGVVKLNTGITYNEVEMGENGEIIFRENKNPLSINKNRKKLNARPFKKNAKKIITDGSFIARMFFIGKPTNKSYNEFKNVIKKTILANIANKTFKTKEEIRPFFEEFININNVSINEAFKETSMEDIDELKIVDNKKEPDNFIIQQSYTYNDKTYTNMCFVNIYQCTAESSDNSENSES